MQHARTDYTERIYDAAGLIPFDEPVLFIRGQDVLAGPIAEAYAALNQAMGGDPAVSESIRRQATRIYAWQEQHGSKQADAPPGVLL